MALVNGFDPSKEYVVVKGFFEGGKNYRPGDKYTPKTKIGKSKVLFRHFIAKRIKKVEETPVKETPKPIVEQSVEEPVTTTPAQEEGFVKEDKEEAPVEEVPKPKTTRRRRKKSTTEDS